MDQIRRTRLTPRWLVKMLIITVALAGLGVWGWVDAAIILPRRGERVASLLEKEYLEAAEQERALRPAQVNIERPEEELAELSRRARQGARTMGALEVARFRWLRSLDLIGRLSPEHTAPDRPPEERLRDLRAEWANRGQPKALAAYDIPFNWLVAVLGFGGALAMLVFLFRVARVRYTWDPEALRLGLPDGSTLEPADITEFDKRKWHKYLVFLKVRPDHPHLAGRTVRLDLLRYTPLERWVLAMEQAARSAEQQGQAPGGSGTPAQPDQP